jgi:two-component system, NtrC family, sensor kinase
VSRGVLIVDDSITVRMDLDAAFRAAGFAPTLCGSGAAARAALSIFALIVLDVVLPDADEIEHLMELKGAAATSGIPEVLLSTEAPPR